jgi:hypothetical protein
MSMKMRIGVIALAFSAATCGVAAAADNTFYIGGSMGQSRPNFDGAGNASGIGRTFKAAGSISACTIQTRATRLKSPDGGWRWSVTCRWPRTSPCLAASARTACA